MVYLDTLVSVSKRRCGTNPTRAAAVTDRAAVAVAAARVVRRPVVLPACLHAGTFL